MPLISNGVLGIHSRGIHRNRGDLIRSKIDVQNVVRIGQPGHLQSLTVAGCKSVRVVYRNQFEVDPQS